MPATLRSIAENVKGLIGLVDIFNTTAGPYSKLFRLLLELVLMCPTQIPSIGFYPAPRARHSNAKRHAADFRCINLPLVDD
jgi:hypothetical protein